MILVETGIPIPKQRIHTVYPFLDLEVGQSFFVPNGNPNSMRVRACLHGKALGRRFKTAKVQGGMRVWRLL